ncbi:MAG: hypothetical protein LBD88_03530 [Candidatus Peribacteria bacterium]|nr:hypothetical protein [Candidatus Peribacteria bacterium]
MLVIRIISQEFFTQKSSKDSILIILKESFPFSSTKASSTEASISTDSVSFTIPLDFKLPVQVTSGHLFTQPL